MHFYSEINSNIFYERQCTVCFILSCYLYSLGRHTAHWSPKLFHSPFPISWCFLVLFSIPMSLDSFRVSFPTSELSFPHRSTLSSSLRRVSGLRLTLLFTDLRSQRRSRDAQEIELTNQISA